MTDNIDKVIKTETYGLEDRIISEGERWEVRDQLDDTTIGAWDSWDCPDPKARALEVYSAWPRMAALYRTKVVKYETIRIARNWDPDEDQDVETPSPE